MIKFINKCNIRKYLMISTDKCWWVGVGVVWASFSRASSRSNLLRGLWRNNNLPWPNCQATETSQGLEISDRETVQAADNECAVQTAHAVQRICCSYMTKPGFLKTWLKLASIFMFVCNTRVKT